LVLNWQIRLIFFLNRNLNSPGFKKTNNNFFLKFDYSWQFITKGFRRFDRTLSGPLQENLNWLRTRKNENQKNSINKWCKTQSQNSPISINASKYRYWSLSNFVDDYPCLKARLNSTVLNKWLISINKNQLTRLLRYNNIVVNNI